MYHLRKIKVLLATCLLACTSLWAQDTKIAISSATANSYHQDYGASKAVDGVMDNHWHSGNKGSSYSTTFPVTFTITLNQASLVDYVRYYPRTDSDNGHWNAVTVSYCSTTTGSNFTDLGSYTLNGEGSVFDFPIGETCGQVKFTINSGRGGWATASEIEAYAYNTEKMAAFAQYFTDGLYTQLKSGVTSSNGIADDDVKTLVEAMLAGAEGYKKFRVGEYEPYMTTATVRNNLKTNSLYNNYENPTGIYLKRGQSCIVAVSGIDKYPVGLKIKDWYKSGDLSTYKLRNGLNYITATTEGNVFVDYYTDDFENAPNVQMHFINAPVLGYWDQATMTNADWEAMLAGPLTEDDEVIIITRSEHAQTAYPVKQWKTYCPTDVNSTMTYYQQVQWAERDIMGLEMFGRQVKNRQLFYADKSGSMYAGGDASVCGYGDLRVLVTPDAKVFDFWGVGHEWGHNNQMAGFHWTGCGETTNNIPASWAQFKFTGNRDANGNPTNLRLEDEVTGVNDYKGMRGGRMQTYFEEGLRKGVQWQLQDGPDYHGATPNDELVDEYDADGNQTGKQVPRNSRNYDHFVKLAPFWQLNLWGILANKNPYIITKVIEAIRTTDNYTAAYNTNGKQQINWMKLACEAAKTDLLPFFENAGLLRPIHAYIEDYGAGWNIITEEMINELKASVADEVAAGRYQAYPDEEINYINGHNYHIYRDNLELNVTAIQGERNGDKVTIQHSVAQNAVAFETYNADGELLRITMYGLGSNDEHSFTQVLFPSSFDEKENAAYIMAVGYDGERQRVYQTYATEDDAKYGELGRILTGVEAMQALCDDTKVGYYKSSALTDLNAAYDIAKAVYDNKESAKYAAVYDMLNTEFMKVENDATARVGIVEGNAYRLENKGYTGRYMSINSEKMIVGETTALTDAQKWYFEASDTEGYYYIKNKSTQTYPGNVETSKKLYADKTTSSEAHAYKLQDMGNGLWALVGGTGLHQGSSAYDYGIVGWDANADASQWYITVVETNTNAEALNNLQVLVDKAEALIAEIEADGAYSTISTETAQSEVATAKNYIASGNYNASVYTQLNEQYTALLNAKKSVDDAALDAKKQGLSTLIDNANDLIDQCGTVTFNAAGFDGKVKLQTTDNGADFYLWTNAQSTQEGNIADLIDGRNQTFFHSDYSGANSSDGLDHHITVNLGDDNKTSEFSFTYVTRHNAETNYPTAIKVYGSVDGINYEEITSLSGLPTGNTENYSSGTIKAGKFYSYLRFMVTENSSNTDKGGHPFFHMAEFELTIVGHPEGYTVTLGNEAGDVTEELLLTAYKAVQEAQSVFDYANTEAQVNEAIEKLQAQYQALEDAKKAVRYQDYAISALITESNVTVVGGGVVYKGHPYTATLTAPNTLTPEDLGAIDVEGYEAMHVVVYDAEIVVTYNKGYTVQVIGGKGNGGVTYNGCDYANGATIYAPASFATSDLAAIVPTGYTLKDISIEDATVKVSFKADPLVDVTKYYTLACRATDHDAYIRDNGSVINGRSEEGSLFQFEAADDDNGYYIKSYVTDSYLNYDGANVSVGAEASTIWTMASHSTGAMTLTIGNDLYLNNNGAANTVCPYLQLKGHNGGPASGNACSLWAITEGTPFDKSALLAKINEFELVVNACVTDPLFVTEQLISEIRNIIADARAKYESKATTQSEYESALTALSAAESRLATAEAEAAARAEQLVVLREWIVTVNDLMARCMENSGDATQALINEVSDALQTANELADSPSSTSSQLADAAADLQAKYAVLDAAQQSTAKAELRALIAQTQALIAECGTYGFGEHMVKTPVALQVNNANAAYYLSTNADQNVVGNSKDGDGIAALIDGNVRSYMHTQWSGTAVGEDHYIQVDLGGQSLAEFTFTYATRYVDNAYYNSPAPAVIEVYGCSDDSESSTKLATFSSDDSDNALPLYTEPGKYWTSATITSNADYEYIRFYVRDSRGPAENTTYGGHHYFGMSEFALKSVSYETSYYVESLTSYGNVTEEQFLNVLNAMGAAEELAKNSYDKDELAAAAATLQSVYDVLVSAHNDYSYLPVTLTTDVENPVLYVMNSKRGAGKVLQYNAGDNDFTIVDATKVNEMVEANASQLFYFSKGTKKGQVYVHPFTAEGQVLAASDKAEGADKVFVAEMDNEYAMQWTFVNATIDDVEWYSLKGVDDAPYFSHHGGGTNKMGFYGSEDDGSRFTFTEKKSHKVTIGQYLHTSLYLDYATTIPEGVKAYIAKNPSEEGTIDLVKLQGDVLPANTGVILYSETPGIYYFLETNATATVNGNLLKGCASEQYVGDRFGGKKYYIFGQKDGVVGLYWARMDYYADGSYVGNDQGYCFKASANKVYLELDAMSEEAPSGFRFRIGEDETGIKGINTNGEAIIYDLYGRRIMEVVTPGIYIINGEKRYINIK